MGELGIVPGTRIDLVGFEENGEEGELVAVDGECSLIWILGFYLIDAIY